VITSLRRRADSCWHHRVAISPARFFADIDGQSRAGRSEAVRYPEIQRMRSVAHEMSAPSNGERLLDVGCGVGEVARQMAAAVGDRGTVVGLDRSQEMIAAAESGRDGSRVTYAVGDIASLEYPADHLDGVRTERVLQHLEDPDGAIAELARVTRPEGRICVVDTDWSSLTHDGFDGMEALLDHLPFDPRHLKVGRTIRARMSRASCDR